MVMSRSSMLSLSSLIRAMVFVLVSCTFACRPAFDAPPGAATGKAAPRNGGVLSVYAVNYPLAYFARRIGGDAVEVSFPAPPLVDPAHWSPDAQTVAAYQAADLVLLNGAAYAKWIDRVTLRRDRLVDTSVSFRDRYIESLNAPTHAHGATGEHAHTGTASTTWLDFRLAAEQARSIADAFAAARPQQRARFQSSLASVVRDMQNLDKRVEAALSGQAHARFLFSDPVYQYFERRYEVSGPSLHWEPDAEPTKAEWRELESALDGFAEAVMLWEAEPLASVRERLDRAGVRSIVYAPCGNRPAEGDFLTVMDSNIRRLAPPGSGDHMK